MPSTTDPGLIGPPTPLPAADAAAAAAVRAAYFHGSTERHLLPAPQTIFNQAALQCCVSCALSAATEIDHPSWPALTAMFHYHVARYDRLVTRPDGRMTLNDGLATLTSLGVCKQSLHTAAYTAAGWGARPSQAAYADALARRPPSSWFSPGYAPISGVSRVVDIRARLKANRPVVIGFTLPQAYKSSIPDARHTWDDPNVPLSSDMHCVLIFGYDDVRQAFRVQDSQGTALFDRGCWWIGYNIADSAIVSTAFYLA